MGDGLGPSHKNLNLKPLGLTLQIRELVNTCKYCVAYQLKSNLGSNTKTMIVWNFYKNMQHKD
jgi:hypothetical protein